MTDNTRDVKLRVGVETAGSAELRKLADDLGTIGTAGGEAAPAVERLARELADAKDSTEDFRKAEAGARADLSANKRALDEKRDALARLRAVSSGAVADEKAHAQAITAARLAIVDQRAALRDKQAAVTAAADAVKQARAAEVALASDLKRVSTAYRETADAAQGAADKQNRANKTVGDGLGDIQRQLSTIRNIAGAAIGGQLLGGMVGDVAKTADAYANLGARIRLVTGEGAAFDEAFQGVFDVATRTNSAVDETGTLFVRLAQAGKQIGLTSRDALALTETINQSIQVSGSSAEASQAAIQQLIQGLQSGVLRGEEFNSVMEQAPRLAQALADGLGVTTGELRKLAEAGQLTSATVIQALQGQSGAVQAEFAKLPATVGRALQNMSTEWTRYVGEVDKANGVSSKAASAINAIAGNLDTLGAILATAGKAWAAYQSLKLAQFFIEKAAAIRVASAALVADTAATVANTAAKQANAAASATATAGIGNMGAAAVQTTGRMAGLMAGVSRLGAVGAVVSAAVIAFDLLTDAVQASRRGVVNLLETLDGSKKRSEELAIAQRADADATYANAQAKAELAQKTRLATEAALGLGAQGKKLVADFDGVIAKGGSTAEAMEKLGKALELDSGITGIEQAGAALDALGQKGALTSTQIADTMAAALKGVDLGTFEANAIAAFDNSEQGARRLKAAIDAIGEEALARAGTSAAELATGFSAAMSSALNNVDALQVKLESLGAGAGDTGRLLAEGLDKALAVANTERAVREVIARTEELGRRGVLSGEQFAQGMERARQKIDELKPGINSLEEALRTFGLKSRAEMQATADNMKASWDQIRNSAAVSLADKQRAFEQYAQAAIAANGGVETSEIALARRMLEIQTAASGAGDAIVSAMGRGRAATDSMTSATERLTAAQRAAQSISGGSGTAGQIGPSNSIPYQSVTGNTREERLKGQNAVDNSLIFTLMDKQRAGTLTEDDLADVKNALAAAKQNKLIDESAGAGSVTFEHKRQIEGMVRSMEQALDDIAGPKLTRAVVETAQKAREPEAKASSTVKTIKIELNGYTSSINVADSASAGALESLLSQLQSAASRA